MKKRQAVINIKDGKIQSTKVSFSECYDFAWQANADAGGKVILLALAENRGGTDNLRALLAELELFMPAPKLHLGVLLRDGLIHHRSGGGYVLDIAVADQAEAAA